MAGDIAAGSINAWHEFIKRYSGLVYSVVRRHLLTDDDDEIRSARVRYTIVGGQVRYEGR